jgi:hypothetical protein
MKSLALLLLAASGCIYDDTPPCVYNETGAGIADIEYRDPATGICQSFGQPCDPACGQACPAGGQILPNWPVCNGACENLTETQCLATNNCHAAYQDDSAERPVFWGCWDMPPSGTIHGACSGLDSMTCAEHDDCYSLYTGPVNQPPNFVPSFEGCFPETPPIACSTLTTEAACTARTDCTPEYIGMNCTCDPSGCTCQTKTFDHCQ